MVWFRAPARWYDFTRVKSSSAALWTAAIATKLCHSTSSEWRREKNARSESHSRDRRCEITFLRSYLPRWSRRRMGSSSKFFEFDQRARTAKGTGRERILERKRERGLDDFTVLLAREFEPTGNLFTPFFECIRRLDNCRSRRRDEWLIWIDRRINRRAKRFTLSNSILFSSRFSGINFLRWITRGHRDQLDVAWISDFLQRFSICFLPDETESGNIVTKINCEISRASCELIF